MKFSGAGMRQGLLCDVLGELIENDLHLLGVLLQQFDLLADCLLLTLSLSTHRRVLKVPECVADFVARFGVEAEVV